MATTQKVNVHGSCHCGKIAYTYAMNAPTAEKPLKAGRCNCTMCQKPGFTSLSVPPSDFTLVKPKSKSELSDYQFRSKDCHRYFCDKCGVQVFGEGKYEFDGKSFDFFTINLNTIDQPQEGVDLSHFSMMYVNGLEDAWMNGTSDKPFSGGTI